jgi:TPR repeat protein
VAAAGTHGADMGGKPPELAPADFARLLGEAELGDRNAQYAVGAAYLNGNGVSREVILGERWRLAAAEQNHVHAQCDLGVLYARASDG